MTKSINDVDTEVDHLRNRVDTIEEDSKKAKTPWYKTPSTLVSGLAFIVSLGTTTVSYFHTQQQDIHSLRGELRGILQRLSALPKEQIEFAAQHKDDQLAVSSYSESLGQESQILVAQADVMVRRLPADQVSAVDHYTIGRALQIANRFPEALSAMQRAQAVATGLDEDLSARRAIASIQMTLGRVEQGRQTFRETLDIFSKYPWFNKGMQDATAIKTKIFWAFTEASIRNFAAATKLLNETQSLIDQYPRSPTTDLFRSQVAFGRQQFAQMQAEPDTAPRIAPLSPQSGLEETPTSKQ